MSGNDQPARNFMLGVHELIVAGCINPVKRSTLSPTCIFSKMPMLDRIFLARRNQYRGSESNTSLLARMSEDELVCRKCTSCTHRAWFPCLFEAMILFPQGYSPVGLLLYALLAEMTSPLETAHVRLRVHELIVAGHINPVKRSTLSSTCIYSNMPMLDRIFQGGMWIIHCFVDCHLT
jgi:hypothetical protein